MWIATKRITAEYFCKKKLHSWTMMCCSGQWQWLINIYDVFDKMVMVMMISMMTLLVSLTGRMSPISDRRLWDPLASEPCWPWKTPRVLENALLLETFQISWNLNCILVPIVIPDFLWRSEGMWFQLKRQGGDKEYAFIFWSRLFCRHSGDLHLQLGRWHWSSSFAQCVSAGI